MCLMMSVCARTRVCETGTVAQIFCEHAAPTCLIVPSTAGGLHLRHRQQHDAGGGAYSMDGPE